MDDPSEVVTPAETFDHSRARVLAALLEAHHTTFYTVISDHSGCLFWVFGLGVL
jgi:hypothetical protein